MADANEINNKKFLSTADDYIKSVLTYETLDNNNARLQLNKMDDTNPITLIDTRYWNRNIVLKDFENTSHTISPLDNLDGDIEFQLPDTIYNVVSGVIINGEGNKLLYGDENSNREGNVLLDDSLKDQSFRLGLYSINGSNFYTINISLEQYNILQLEDLEKLKINIKVNSEDYSSLSIASLIVNNSNYYIGLNTNELNIGDINNQNNISTYTIQKKVTIISIKETELIYDAEKSALSLGRAENTEIGQKSIAWGDRVEASGDYSLAFGPQAKVQGNASIALGPLAESVKNASISIGYQAKAEEKRALALGVFAHASAEGSLAIGTDVLSDQEEQIAIGRYNSSNDKAFFIVGDGTSDEKRHNALTLEEGGVQTLCGNSTGNTYLWISGTLPTGLNVKDDYASTIRTNIGDVISINNNYPIENINFGLGLGRKYLGLWFGRNDGLVTESNPSPIIPEFKNGDTDITPYIAPSGWIMNFNPCGGDWVDATTDLEENLVPAHPVGEVAFDRNVKFNQGIRLYDNLYFKDTANGISYDSDSDPALINMSGNFNFNDSIVIDNMNEGLIFKQNSHFNTNLVFKPLSTRLILGPDNKQGTTYSETLVYYPIEGQLQIGRFTALQGFRGGYLRLENKNRNNIDPSKFWDNSTTISPNAALLYYENQLCLAIQAADGGGTKTVLKEIQLGNTVLELEDD